MDPTDPKTWPSATTGVLRVAVAFGAGEIARHGWATNDQASTTLGALALGAMGVWSWVAHWRANQKLKDAIAAPIGQAKP